MTFTMRVLSLPFFAWGLGGVALGEHTDPLPEQEILAAGQIPTSPSEEQAQGEDSHHRVLIKEIFGDQAEEDLLRALDSETGFDEIIDAFRGAIREVRDLVPQGCGIRPKEPEIRNCDDFDAQLEFLFRGVKYEICSRRFSRNIDTDTVVTEAFDRLFDTCFPEIVERALEEELPEQHHDESAGRFEGEEQERRTKDTWKFCASRFEEGTYDGAVPIPDQSPFYEGIANQYGWGAHFNDQCGYGIMIHSAGTRGYTTFSYSLPTFTIRDGAGNIVFEGIYSDGANPLFGIRSATVVQCNGSVVTVIAASVGRPAGSFLRFDFDLNTYNGRPAYGIVPTWATEMGSPSVRSIQMISDSTLLYAPLNDLDGLFAETQLRVFDWQQQSDLGISAVLVEPWGAPFGDFIWDFECSSVREIGASGHCWVSIVTTVDLKVSATLRYFPLAMVLGLLPGERATIPATRLETTFDFPFSAMSMEPLGANQAVVCTLSGWIYRVAEVVEFLGFEVRRRDRRLVGPADFLRNFLNRLELGYAQQCNVCDASGWCANIPFDGLTTASTYVWQVTECDDKVFAGILDFSSAFGDQYIILAAEGLADFACTFPNLLARGGESKCFGNVMNSIENYLRRNALRRTYLAANAAANVYDDDITGEDFGFDLFYAETADIVAGNAVFKPITRNGFRELAPGNNVDKETKGNNPFDFDPSSYVDDGIRTMVCHSDENGNAALVMGSAVFGLYTTSNTFVLDLKDNC